MNHALTGGERDRMGPARRCGLAALAAILSLMAGPVAADGVDSPEAVVRRANAALVGEYRHSTVSASGKIRRSVAVIAARSAGLSVSWQEDEGNLFGGIGVGLDGVFGAAYTESLNGTFRGNGIVAYRVNGGTLDGVRLPSDPKGPALVRETLEGPPGLEGRFVIARSLDGDGRTYHSGSVEIERHGDTYQMTWRTAGLTYDGVGLRIGDVLVAGYAHGFAPGIVAYCADEGLLTGIVTYGHAATIRADSMTRAHGGEAGAKAEQSARCRDAISRWNPSLVQG